MRKYTSVLSLMARSTLYPILVVLIFMSAIEIGLFYYFMPTEGIVYELYDVVQQAHLRWVFAGAFAVISFFLTRTGCERGSKVGYTLKRLSVSERQVFALQSIYNVLCYLLLWMVQVLLAIGLNYYYVQNTPANFVTGQIIFLSLDAPSDTERWNILQYLGEYRASNMRKVEDYYDWRVGDEYSLSWSESK